MTIWKHQLDLNKVDKKTLLGGAANSLGIELVEVKADSLFGKMPVDQRTTQPYGLLNGGASCVLAETLGSIAANLCIEEKGKKGVGMSLNASHVRPASTGYVWGEARPKHIGRRSQVWEIAIKDDGEKLVSLVTLTVSVI